ncbi:hypothetical protein NBG4_170030 [Candidatus Sulfobium mesophilum]|uniref:Uncharacterized protein n=1 Tax=Candidatus Sulfobium mesophilum TaxID=2016548 RepID=A0A2U3QFJ8_9BACT|nr:hypothetical protein NBG4_170030 [Candidatus Sulfobium mesophilum]
MKSERTNLKDFRLSETGLTPPPPLKLRGGDRGGVISKDELLKAIPNTFGITLLGAGKKW